MNTLKIDKMRLIIRLISCLLLIFTELIYSLTEDKNLVQTGSEMERVINGLDATLGQFPYVVRIRDAPEGYYPSTICTGALITKKTVLTAAHCIVNDTTGEVTPVSMLDGILGSVDVNDEKNKVTFKKFHVHEYYNTKTYENDIATFILKNPAELDNIIKTIALADVGLDISGRKATAVGWGLYTYDQEDDTNLHYMEINVADARLCSQRFPTKFNPSKQICSGQRDDMCTEVGDSGGPLIIKGLTQDISVGVLSFGPNVTTCVKDRSVYTSVSVYKGWIIKNSIGDVSFVK